MKNLYLPELSRFLKNFTGEQHLFYAANMDVPTKTANSIQAVAMTFGKTVTYVKDNQDLTQEGYRFDVISITDKPNTIFIRADSDEPYLKLLGYQLVKSMKIKHPEIYDSLKESVMTFSVGKVRGLDIVSRSDNLGLSEDATHELVADFIGRQFNKKDFWKHYSSTQSPSLINRFKEAATEFYSRVCDKLKQLGFVSARSGTVERRSMYTSINKCITDIINILDDYAQLETSQIKSNRVESKQAVFKYRQNLDSALPSL